MVTRLVCSFALLSLFFLCSRAQTISTLQNRTVKTSYDFVYDNKAWAFNAGAPVRSTVLVKNGILFFGTAKGDFFAVDKKSRLIKWQFNSGYAIHSSASA